jgi:hypothetical protein
MAVSTDYSGKSIDLCVLETGQAEGLDDVNVGIAASGQVISGPYKVIQKYFKFLFTSQGSIPSDPAYGTKFLDKVLGGAVPNIQALQLQFYSSSPGAVAYVLNSNPQPAPDETLTKVLLDSFSIYQNTAIIRIKFSFADSSVVTVPVSISTV